MAFKITTIHQSTEEQGLKVLVHGPAGAGKTVLCGTTGVPEKTLILSAEAGLLSLRSHPEAQKFAVAKIETIEDLIEAHEKLLIENPFDWVCLDSISEIAEQVLSHQKTVSKDGRAAYGNLNDIMLKLLRDFRDLPCNVYMSCKQSRELNEDLGRTLFVPSMPGRSLSQGISYLFDEVFALRIDRDEDGPFRVLVTQADGRHEVKDRSGILDAVEVPSLSHIYNKIINR
jgi:hypothetical protein